MPGDTSGELSGTVSAKYVDLKGDVASLNRLDRSRDYTKQLGETPEQRRINEVARVLDFDDGDDGIQRRLAASFDTKTQKATLPASFAETRLLKTKYPDLNLTLKDVEIYFSMWKPLTSNNQQIQ